MIVISKSLPTALLTSCRVIFAEAKPFLEFKLVVLRDTERFHLPYQLICRLRLHTSVL
jgi:hypothetical protein